MVHEEGALAAHRLRDQRLLTGGPLPQPQHGRVELHELEVPQTAPARSARAILLSRWRRAGSWSPRRPGPCHRWPAPPRGSDRPDSLLLALAHHVQGDPGDRAVGGQLEVERQGVLDDRDAGFAASGRDQGALDLGAGGVASWAWSTRRRRCPPSRVSDSSPPGVWSNSVPRSMSVRTASGPSADERADRLHVAEAGPRDQGVVQVLLGSVPRPECGGDPALGPRGRPGGE